MKFAYFSIANEVIVITKKRWHEDTISVVMNHQKINKDINEDVDDPKSRLPELSHDELKKYCKIRKCGTQLVFKGLNKHLSGHDIRAILAMRFHFSYVLKSYDKFEIFVGDDKKEGKIGIKDIAGIYQETQFAWFFNKKSKSKFFDDMQEAGIETKFERKGMIRLLDKIKSDKLAKINGYIMSVENPHSLYVSTDQKKPRQTEPGPKELRASIALFATGMMREFDFIAKITTKDQFPENYLFGEIHIDSMDNEDDDRFTSGRDGVMEGDDLYIEFQELMSEVLLQVIGEWKKWRKEFGDPDHDEPKTAQARLAKRADEMFAQVIKNRKLVPRDQYSKHPLTKYIRRIARRNVPSYMECFIAENMMRHYIDNKKVSCSSIREIPGYKSGEEKAKNKAGITFPIKESFMGMNNNDINYMSSCQMVSVIKKHLRGTHLRRKSDSIAEDVKYQVPIRNSLMHTSLLTKRAKNEGDACWQRITCKILDLLGWIKQGK